MSDSPQPGLCGSEANMIMGYPKNENRKPAGEDEGGADARGAKGEPGPEICAKSKPSVLSGQQACGEEGGLIGRVCSMTDKSSSGPREGPPGKKQPGGGWPWRRSAGAGQAAACPCRQLCALRCRPWLRRSQHETGRSLQRPAARRAGRADRAGSGGGAAASEAGKAMKNRWMWEMLAKGTAARARSPSTPV